MIILAMTLENILGTAACCMGVSVALVGLPIQILKNYRRKSVEGISFAFWILAYLNGWLWTAYASSKIAIDWYMIAANIPGLFFTSVLLFQFYKYRNRGTTNSELTAD